MNDKVTELILKRFDDLQDTINIFRVDAEKKIDSTKTVLKDEISLRFDDIKDEVNDLKNKMDSFERKNEVLNKHQFQIEKMDIDIQNISKKVAVDMKTLNEKINNHIKTHNNELPKKAVDNFKIAAIWGIIGLIGTGLLTMIIGVFVKNFNNLINFLTKIFV